MTQFDDLMSAGFAQASKILGEVSFTWNGKPFKGVFGDGPGAIAFDGPSLVDDVTMTLVAGKAQFKGKYPKSGDTITVKKRRLQVKNTNGENDASDPSITLALGPVAKS